MAKAHGSRHERCRSWAHKWEQEVCTVCFADSPAGAASRAFNARLARIVAAGASVYDVPPPPDYSTREAVQDRALEFAHPWYREFVRLGRQDGRPYRAFRRAVERTGATLALPFPTSAVRVLDAAPVSSPARAPRRLRAFTERIPA